MKYIKFLDADDLILSDSTRLLVEILRKILLAFLPMVFKEKLIILLM